MPVTTTFTIEGYRIAQYLGIVRGIIVRAPTISQGIHGRLEVDHRRTDRAHIPKCANSPAERVRPADRPRGHCQRRNAIVWLRYDASEIGGKASSASEVLCYGTAVVIEPVR